MTVVKEQVFSDTPKGSLLHEYSGIGIGITIKALITKDALEQLADMKATARGDAPESAHQSRGAQLSVPRSDKIHAQRRRAAVRKEHAETSARRRAEQPLAKGRAELQSTQQAQATEALLVCGVCKAKVFMASAHKQHAAHQAQCVPPRKRLRVEDMAMETVGAAVAARQVNVAAMERAQRTVVSDFRGLVLDADGVVTEVNIYGGANLELFVQIPPGSRLVAVNGILGDQTTEAIVTMFKTTRAPFTLTFDLQPPKVPKTGWARHVPRAASLESKATKVSIFIENAWLENSRVTCNVLEERMRADPEIQEHEELLSHQIQQYLQRLYTNKSKKVEVAAAAGEGVACEDTPEMPAEEAPVEEDEVEEDEAGGVCQGCHLDEEEAELVYCGDEDHGCGEAYHLYCLEPALRPVPQETWLCQWCTSGGN